MYTTRIIIFTVLCKLAVTVAVPLHPFSDAFINLINKEGKWKAGRNFPADTPITYIKNLIGTPVKLDLKTLPTITHDPKVIKNLPESFDPRDKWPECPTLNEIRDQGRCGACWAFSGVAAMTDRVCIYSNGTKHFHFSAEDVISCNSVGFGCFGGSIAGAWQEWVNVGIVSGGNYNSHQGCKPYSFPTCKNHMKSCTDYKPAPLCVKSCKDGYPIPYNKDKRRGKELYGILAEEQIMAELYLNGPVQASFEVYEDFANYKSGIYQHLKGVYVGEHSVKKIGWGVENGTKYWLIANSWGTSFGENGFFKTVRGENNDIDSLDVAGVPLLEDY